MHLSFPISPSLMLFLPVAEGHSNPIRPQQCLFFIHLFSTDTTRDLITCSNKSQVISSPAPLGVRKQRTCCQHLPIFISATYCQEKRSNCDTTLALGSAGVMFYQIPHDLMVREKKWGKKSVNMLKSCQKVNPTMSLLGVGTDSDSLKLCFSKISRYSGAHVHCSVVLIALRYTVGMPMPLGKTNQQYQPNVHYM